METTCTWLHNNDSYRAWLQRENVEDHRGLLWIKGKPGSGKSTIMKAAVDKFLAQPGTSRPLIASFFFSSKGVELERTAMGFLRSMTYQPLIADENIRQQFLNMFIQAWIF
jgi:ABC-type lipoprotein export system ATPase subunit